MSFQLAFLQSTGQQVATTHIAPERSERMRSIKMVFHHLEFMGNSWSHLSFRLEANREHVCNV